MEDFIAFTSVLGQASFVRKLSIDALLATRLGDTVGTTIVIKDRDTDQSGMLVARESPEELMRRMNGRSH